MEVLSTDPIHRSGGALRVPPDAGRHAAQRLGDRTVGLSVASRYPSAERFGARRLPATPT